MLEAEQDRLGMTKDPEKAGADRCAEHRLPTLSRAKHAWADLDHLRLLHAGPLAYFSSRSFNLDQDKGVTLHPRGCRVEEFGLVQRDSVSD